VTKAFEFKEMTKHYPGFTLGPLNFSLEPGVVLGYIGPNGAGKTTTMQCMAGLLKTDGGKIEIFGVANNPYKPSWKLDIGYVGDKHVFYERWNGTKNLDFLSRFYPNWSSRKAQELAARLRLPLDKSVRTLSTGNRVKLALVSALAHSPRLLILDEPTAGLDPVAKEEFLDELYEVLQDGERAIFYSTHNLADFKRLIDELAFIDKGQIFSRASKEDLLENWRTISCRLQLKEKQIDGAVKIESEGDHIKMTSRNRIRTIAHLGKLGAREIQESPMGIDEIAVEIMKGGENVVNDKS